MRNLKITVNGVVYDVQVEETGASAPAAAPVSADTSADDALEKEIRHQTAITAAIAIVSVILFIFALVWFMTSVKKPDNAPEGQDVTQKTD